MIKRYSNILVSKQYRVLVSMYSSEILGSKTFFLHFKIHENILWIVTTLFKTKGWSFCVSDETQDSAILLSVKNFIEWIGLGDDLTTPYMSSVPNRIAPNSFLGIEAAASLDLAVNNAQE